jgi:hypothetical protein
MERHIKNAFVYNLDTHFYRAIRKYGVADIETKVLFTTTNKKDATNKEIELIEKHNTILNGYNTAKGGTGGVTIDRIKDPEKYKQWYDKKLQKVQGVNNPRYCGVTDQELINEAVSIILLTQKLTTADWRRFATKHGLPQSFSKMRFGGGGWKSFKLKIKEECNNRDIPFSDDIFKYVKTEKHKQKISKTHINKNFKKGKI